MEDKESVHSEFHDIILAHWKSLILGPAEQSGNWELLKRVRP